IFECNLRFGFIQEQEVTKVLFVSQHFQLTWTVASAYGNQHSFGATFVNKVFGGVSFFEASDTENSATRYRIQAAKTRKVGRRQKAAVRFLPKYNARRNGPRIKRKRGHPMLFNNLLKGFT